MHALWFSLVFGAGASGAAATDVNDPIVADAGTSGSPDSSGIPYAAINEATGNRIQTFNRGADGQVHPLTRIRSGKGPELLGGKGANLAEKTSVLELPRKDI